MIAWFESWRLRRQAKWNAKNPLGMHGKIMGKCSGTERKCNWVEQGHGNVRICLRCQAEDWLYINPEVPGDLTHEWRRMQ